VGFFSRIFWGNPGSAKLAKNLVTNIAKNKEVEEVKILTIEPENVEFLKDLEYDIYRVRTCAKPPFDSYEFLLKSLSYDKYFKDVDIIHVEHSFEGVLAQKCKKKYRVPFILVREIVSKQLPSLYSKLVLFNLEKFLTLHLRYDVLVSASQYMVDNYFTKWGIDLDRIRVIHAGIDTEEFKPKKKFKNIRKRYSIDENDFLIFSIKVLSKSNMLSLANSILAFNLFVKKYPDSKYMIAGLGHRLSYLIQMVKKLGIQKNVIFVTNIPQSELPDYYLNADITAHYFSYEAASSGSILESLACGIPPIATGIGEIPNILNEKSGIITNLDIESFSHAMEKMYLMGEKNRKIMGRNARKLAEEKFDIRTIAKKYVDLYKEVIG
jgi:glycosyltransferase involved in cell wall biosynthesis